MGAVLDSAENIRQNKKGASWQAHKAEAKLAQDKIKGVKMTTKTTYEDTKVGKNVICEIMYMGKNPTFFGKMFYFQAFGGLERQVILVFPDPNLRTDGLVPTEVQIELSEIIQKQFGYGHVPIIYPQPRDLILND